jgi:hypothetical protein
LALAMGFITDLEVPYHEIARAKMLWLWPTHEKNRFPFWNKQTKEDNF